MATQNQKRVGVVLSGCGYLDGSEIHEATLTLLALDRLGAKTIAMAPDVQQMHVIDHLAGAAAGGENRRVLIEAARIARGQITDIAKVSSADLDALVFPGGYGAAKNLSTFAVDGTALRVNPEVTRLVEEMHRAAKPMGFVCIAPVIAARVLGKSGPKLTIGNDQGTAAALESLGARHVCCQVDGIVIDSALKIVSTPAYMEPATIAKVAVGIEKLAAAVLELA
ncbi:MAG: isoprenoid biosynthesis glyoxalase ElbB [Pseudomonadota bacterium]